MLHHRGMAAFVSGKNFQLRSEWNGRGLVSPRVHLESALVQRVKMHVSPVNRKCVSNTKHYLTLQSNCSN